MDCVFWAVCLVLFFGLLRKSNVIAEKFDPEKQLTRDSVVVAEDKSIVVQTHYSKTIQNKERTLSFRLPCIAPHPLCPVKAVIAAFRHTAPAAPKDQAFPISSAKFTSRLKALAGIEYGTHSFRRGGATHALSCGIPGEVIKVMGDWKSSCYLQYLDALPSHVLDYYRSVFAANVSLTT